MKKVLISIAILIAIMAFLLVYNSYLDRPSPQKLTAMSLLGCGEIIKENHAAIRDLDKGCRAAIAEIRYSKEDQITLYDQKYQLHLTYTPKNTNGKIEWVCQGEPKKYFPLQSR